MNTPKIIIISGPSGSGKGTVIDGLPADFKKAVSVTTRSPRPGEIDGVDYLFISHDRFESMIQSRDILEFNCFDGQYYGTPRSQITDILADGRNVVLDVDVHGFRNIKREYPEAICIFLAAPDVHVQEARIRSRNTNNEGSILARLKQARTELTYAPEFDCILFNEDGKCQDTVQAILRIVQGEFPDRQAALQRLSHYFDTL